MIDDHRVIAKSSRGRYRFSIFRHSGNLHSITIRAKTRGKLIPQTDLPVDERRIKRDHAVREYRHQRRRIWKLGTASLLSLSLALLLPPSLSLSLSLSLFFSFTRAAVSEREMRHRRVRVRGSVIS